MDLTRVCITAAMAMGLATAVVAVQSVPAGRTAAEANRNIQVLKTLPATELLPAMQFIA